MKKCVAVCIALFLTVCLHAAVAGAGTAVTWSTLKTLDKTNKKTAAAALDGKLITIPGFMVPFEDDADDVTEFLLVPFAGACIHVPPPPPNQMIYVKLSKGKKTKFPWSEPISVTGTLHVATVDSPYGDVSYNMDGETVSPYQQ